MIYTYFYLYICTDNCLNPMLIRILFITLMSCVKTMDIYRAFVFYCLYCRLKVFSSVLKTEKRDILPMQNVYKTIVDLAEKQKSALDPLFLISICYTIFEIMAIVVYITQDMKMGNNIGPRTAFWIVAQRMVHLFAPALCADYLCALKNKILVILHDKLIQEQEENRQLELEQFLRYVEARDLRFRVYKVIPLDASLLTMVLNFTVTYLIVIIQFINK